MDSSPYQHGVPAEIGILVTNLGTPDDCTPVAVRRYLREFLSDKRVVELPRLIWWPILNFIILTIRSRYSAAAYANIWTDEGSPLLNISHQLTERLSLHLPQYKFALGMRYGRPSIREAMEQLRESGARRILILPLYPQYSAATTASTVDAVADTLRNWRWVPELRTLYPYHDDPNYIAALAHSVYDYRTEYGSSDVLLISFHGMPQASLIKGDPYHCQCHKTARLLAEALELPEDAWRITFQSRFGPANWLQPYTEQTLTELAKAGKSVQVICPGFSADCLETLEEIALAGRDIFLATGGESFAYIPCLNDTDAHVGLLGALIEYHCVNWGEAEPPEELAASRHRALALGAEG